MKKYLIASIFILSLIVVSSVAKASILDNLMRTVVSLQQQIIALFQRRGVVTTTATSSISDWQTYKNEQYGFSLLVPSNWVAKMTTGPSNSYVSFSVPGFPNYDLFGISVFKPEKWREMKDIVPVGTCLGENSKYIFSSTHILEFVSELKTELDKIEKVKSSFKITSASGVPTVGEDKIFRSQKIESIDYPNKIIYLPSNYFKSKAPVPNNPIKINITKDTTIRDLRGVNKLVDFLTLKVGDTVFVRSYGCGLLGGVGNYTATQIFITNSDGLTSGDLNVLLGVRARNGSKLTVEQLNGRSENGQISEVIILPETEIKKGRPEQGEKRSIVGLSSIEVGDILTGFVAGNFKHNSSGWIPLDPNSYLLEADIVKPYYCQEYYKPKGCIEPTSTAPIITYVSSLQTLAKTADRYIESGKVVYVLGKNLFNCTSVMNCEITVSVGGKPGQIPISKNPSHEMFSFIAPELSSGIYDLVITNIATGQKSDPVKVTVGGFVGH